MQAGRKKGRSVQTSPEDSAETFSQLSAAHLAFKLYQKLNILRQDKNV